MNKTVIVCDDDEGILDVTTIILEQQGYTVIPLSNGIEIFNKIKRYKPRLILLDLWMPEITGEAITRELKGNPETKDIPIIIVSANKDTQAIALSAGADDFLCKPFDINDLERKVEQFIGEGDVKD